MSDSRDWFKKNCRMNNGNRQLTEGQRRRALAGSSGTYVSRIQFADSSAEERDNKSIDRHNGRFPHMQITKVN